ncbi:hypothetical protein SAMN05216321_101106 [Cupriavidus sp. OV038]|jgi:hypothetical protein|uniref:phage baseplate plug family protein n=1 Tax=unclassified Cupriavidus TaxID=2640874 RepID=UPI0008EEF8E7|nr:MULTISPECIES: hypothetical protein [unclassified Cupriavidus]SFB68464.1 hypothetical protein SAMN05216321_101106 [Cupriavidus sp. OV038]SFO57715.1 hypothetical protein SAMN05216322_101106 [Cupriavidus sp. OV096]
MEAIPVIDANDSQTEVELDGRTFFLHISWNSEAEVWSLAIENAYNELVVSGIAMVPDFPLLAQYRHLSVPDGELLVLTPDGRDTISRVSLPRGDVELLYIGADALTNGTL